MKSFRQFLSEATYITHPRMNQAPWARPDWVPPRVAQEDPQVAAYKASRMGTGLDATPDRTPVPEKGGFYPIGGRADQTRSSDPFQMNMKKAPDSSVKMSPFSDPSARLAHSQDPNVTPRKPLKANTPVLGSALPPEERATQGPSGTRVSFYNRRYAKPGE